MQTILTIVGTFILAFFLGRFSNTNKKIINNYYYKENKQDTKKIKTKGFTPNTD
jgi:hypothetical protein